MFPHNEKVSCLVLKFDFSLFPKTYKTLKRYKDPMKRKAKYKPVVYKLNGPSKSIKGLTILDEEALGWVGVSD